VAAGAAVAAHATVAAVAADGLVVNERAVTDHEFRAAVVDRAPRDTQAAAAAIAAIPADRAVPTRAADALVVQERSVCHDHGRGGKRPEQADGLVAEGTAHARAGVPTVRGGRSPVGPVAPVRQVALEGAVPHRRLAAAGIVDGAAKGVALDASGRV